MPCWKIISLREAFFLLFFKKKKCYKLKKFWNSISLIEVIEWYFKFLLLFSFVITTRRMNGLENRCHYREMLLVLLLLLLLYSLSFFVLYILLLLFLYYIFTLFFEIINQKYWILHPYIEIFTRTLKFAPVHWNFHPYIEIFTRTLPLS